MYIKKVKKVTLNHKKIENKENITNGLQKSGDNNPLRRDFMIDII